MSEINWYPGHMAKTKKQLETQIKGVDAVIELSDARAPLATRNPDLLKLTDGKARVLVLNKSDLADDSITSLWLKRFRQTGLSVIAFKSTGGKTRDIFRLIENAVADKVERMKQKGVNKTVRVMVVGIPNVGKSTFINALKGHSIAQTGDRPGVTRSNQWVKINPYLELLDTPGMLWPKLENQNDALKLAFLGSINDDAMDTEALSRELLRLLSVIAPDKLTARYKLDKEALTLNTDALLEACCKARGFLLPGGRFDTLRCAQILLDEFRGGKIGKISLEKANEVL